MYASSSQARFDAGELITQRELVSRQVSEDLTERASTFGLILDDVSLVRSYFYFSLNFSNAHVIFWHLNMDEQRYGVFFFSDTLDLWKGIHRGC